MSATLTAIVDGAYQDYWNAQNADRAAEFLTEDFVDRDPNVDPGTGLAGYVAMSRAYWAAVPDITMTAIEHLAAGDRVVTRFVLSGTHEGEIGGQPPTGRKFSVEGIGIYTFRDGRICEMTVAWDGLGLNRQLGVDLL
ncbi:MAG: ester cyclase [Sporichthyaceae bacterium]